MALVGPPQVTFLPKQLGRLAEHFPDGGAVGVTQEGSTIHASNGIKSVHLDSQGELLYSRNDNPNQKGFPLC